MKKGKKDTTKEMSEIKKSKQIIKKEKEKIKKIRFNKIKNSKFFKMILKFDNNNSIRNQILNMLYYEFIGIILCLLILYILSGGKNYFKIYYELYKFIDTYDTITTNYYGKIDKKEMINSATSALVSNLDDSFTNYNNKKVTEDFEETIKGTYEGIGATVTTDKEKNIVVAEVFEDTPAAKAGLKAKDIIKMIDENDFSKKTSDDMANYVKSSKKSKIKITILRDNEEKEIIIKRGIIKVPTVISKIIKKDNKKIGYLNISVFSTVTTNQFKAKLKKLEKENINALIIDVRNNNGGYLKTAGEISSMFLKKGKIIYQLSDKKGTTKERDKTKEHRTYPVAVLVNKYSASASEILAAAIKESYNGYVIGTKTYGKGTVQKVKNLKDGTMIKYTVQKWLTPKGNWINKKGLTPTNKIELKDTKNDNQLETTINILIDDLKK